MSVVVLISGSGTNLKALLDATAHENYPARVVAVGADRECAGLEYAEERNLPSFIVDPADFPDRDAWAKELVDVVDPWEPDLIVCAGFMRVLPPRAVRAWSPRVINMHPALLPSYPGAHAVRDALADGATETGTTIHIVDEGVDTGPIIRQREVPVELGDTEATLHERIKLVERHLLVETVADIAARRIDLEEMSRR